MLKTNTTENMKVAVTLASGQLGSAICKELIDTIGATNVIGIARTPKKAAHLGIEVRKGDYDNPEDFKTALKGIDAVLTVSGNGQPDKRIQQHRNVIEGAKYNGVKKIVYTSITGNENDSDFSPVVSSNRKTEDDVRQSGLDWVIGRNGIYIEPDIEYIDQYIKEGGIKNCAGNGRCKYTSRPELARAYTKIVLEEKHNQHTYNLVGEPLTQNQLAEVINQVYATNLSYTSVSVEAYTKERKEALGDFLGSVIAGIYENMRQGIYDIPSDYEKASGRPHKSALKMIQEIKNS